MHLKSETQLRKQLQHATEQIKDDFAPFEPSSLVGDPTDLIILDQEYNKFSIKQKLFSRIKFKHCRFKNCLFEKVEFNGVEFVDCEFTDCYFTEMIFMDMSMKNVKFIALHCHTVLFGMMGLENVVFENSEFQFLTLSDCHTEKVVFSKSWVTVAKFESGDIYYAYRSEMYFDKCTMQDVIFVDLDLSATQFQKCDFGGCSFNNSILLTNSIEPANEKCYQLSNIDFRTIEQSENLSRQTLEYIFGIHHPFIKDEVTKWLKSSRNITVFISHSFEDAIFADLINQKLNENGIRTFYWTHDALGAKKLKAIMADEIRTYDYFLFISSQHSLKSQSCHYEIEIARQKYYSSWKDILVPIHLDSSLFTIDEYKIPLPFRKQFWENILELREIHSLDFSMYFDKALANEWENQFQKLIKTLHLTHSKS